MLKAKIAELMNEPACALNQAKKDKGKSCKVKQLTPGAAAGGCAFDGAKIALQPITDAIHLVHGPIACEGNSWDTRNSASSFGNLYRHGFTDDLGNLDIIHGGEKKLYKAIRQAVKQHNPAAVFVYQTCVGALIGDDVTAVCKAAQERLGVPIIPVEAPGFVGSKNLGNRLAGEALLDHVIGTHEPEDKTLYDVNLLGEYNVAGELAQIKPLLAALGIRLRTSISGDARYKNIAAAHTARVNMVVCSQALVTLARKMEENWGIPYFEGSFYGLEDIRDALSNFARLLVERGADPQLLAKTQAFIAEQEGATRQALVPLIPMLKGKKVLLYTGGVKSWSLINTLHELGMEVIGTSVRKSTESDKEKALARLQGAKEKLYEQIPPKEMYAMFKEGRADIMLSGGRSQFVALKAKTPWLDVNQERHHAYAGYQGMLNLAQQITLSLHNPLWQHLRKPAPWEGELL